MCMCAYAPFWDQETFELRMYLCNFTVCHASQRLFCMYTHNCPGLLALPAPYSCVCVYLCACVCVSYRSICRDHGLGQIPRWIPTCRVALYFVYMPELPGSNNAEKPDTHRHMSVCVCLSKPAQGAPRLICLCALWWVAATVRTRCGLSNCPAKMLLLLLLLLENEWKIQTNTQSTCRLGSMESNVFLNICNNYQLHTKIYAIYLTYNACMRVCIHVCVGVCVCVFVWVGWYCEWVLG